MKGLEVFERVIKRMKDEGKTTTSFSELGDYAEREKALILVEEANDERFSVIEGQLAKLNDKVYGSCLSNNNIIRTDFIKCQQELVSVGLENDKLKEKLKFEINYQHKYMKRMLDYKDKLEKLEEITSQRVMVKPKNMGRCAAKQLFQEWRKTNRL